MLLLEDREHEMLIIGLYLLHKEWLNKTQLIKDEMPDLTFSEIIQLKIKLNHLKGAELEEM